MNWSKQAIYQVRLSITQIRMNTLQWVSRRGDSSLLPKSSETQQERGGGFREGAGAERQGSTYIGLVSSKNRYLTPETYFKYRKFR